MTPALQPAIKRAVKYLQRIQEPTGNFIGQAGPERTDFTPTIRHSTVFFTSLILNCLTNVPGTAVMKRHAADFLLQQKSNSWSWNYWQRGSRMAKAYPYPDDLDDTACALAALLNYKPQLIDGAALGQVAQLLIASEIAPGGPYRTWLIDTHALPQWSSIDTAVNANIGYFLSLQGVELPALNKYISHAITTNDLASQYYINKIPTLYFIARWYHGPELECLQSHIAREINNSSKQTDLMVALLVSAGCHAGLNKKELEPLVSRLIQNQHRNNAWPPAPLYRDPQIRGVSYLAGSAALTTAFVVEALTTYNSFHGPHVSLSKSVASNIVDDAMIEVSGLSAELRQNLSQKLTAVTGKDNQQITSMAQLTADIFGRKLPSSVQKHLNLGSIYGWTAYTIYDDFLDQEGRPEELGAANVAQRLMLDHFQFAVPSHPHFQHYVREVLQHVDAANTWETTHARGTVTGRFLEVEALPTYGDYRQLADRSWGHVLAAVGSLQALGYGLDSAEVKAMEDFFRHLLIAKQFNDDAHDWEEDLSRGHLSSVVALLLADKKFPLRLNISQQPPELRLRFWQETIMEVVQLIEQHCSLAHKALDDCPTLTHTQVQKSWIHRQERSGQEALQKREDTYKFISSYHQQ